MAQGKKITAKAQLSVAAAVRRKDEAGIVKAIISKYAKVIDECDSARDMKPLASGIFEAIDRLNAINARDVNTTDTPLAQIINMDEFKKAVGQ